MAGNQVTLTFAGESSNLERSFDNVGSSAEHMGARAGESAGGIERAGEAADGAESKAQGFADTLTGTADIAAGTSEIMKGNLFEGFVTVGGGMADLAGGLASFLIPALGKAKTAVLGMNFAFLSSPVFWLVAAIVVLVGAIVLIATKTDWFQRAWKNSWNWIKSAAKNTVDWFKKVPGYIGQALSTVASVITAPYRAAFNGIARLWNATVGRLSWSVPDWVPFIGGRSISVPNLPTFHAGGRVPGSPGQAVPILAMAGERVSANGDGGADGLIIETDGSRMADALLELLAGAVRRRGGKPAVLGIR